MRMIHKKTDETETFWHFQQWSQHLNHPYQTGGQWSQRKDNDESTSVPKSDYNKYEILH